MKVPSLLYDINCQQHKHYLIFKGRERDFSLSVIFDFLILHDFGSDFAHHYKFQSKTNLTVTALCLFNIIASLTHHFNVNVSSKAKLIPPTTTRTRTSARGTPTEQPVRRVSVQLLSGSLINNMGSWAFVLHGTGLRTRSSPSSDRSH